MGGGKKTRGRSPNKEPFILLLWEINPAHGCKSKRERERRKKKANIVLLTIQSAPSITASLVFFFLHICLFQKVALIRRRHRSICKSSGALETTGESGWTDWRDSLEAAASAVPVHCSATSLRGNQMQIKTCPPVCCYRCFPDSFGGAHDTGVSVEHVTVARPFPVTCAVAADTDW